VEFFLRPRKGGKRTLFVGKKKTLSLRNWSVRKGEFKEKERQWKEKTGPQGGGFPGLGAERCRRAKEEKKGEKSQMAHSSRDKRKKKGIPFHSPRTTNLEKKSRRDAAS